MEGPHIRPSLASIRLHSSTSVISCPPITSLDSEGSILSESEDLEHSDTASEVQVSDSESDSGLDLLGSEESSNHYDIRRVALGTFDSTKMFIQGLDDELQIRILVISETTLIPMLNFLTLEGFRYLIDKERRDFTLRVFFGRVQAHVERAYSAQVHHRRIPLSSVDFAVGELLTDCKPWDVLLYNYTSTV